MCVFLLSLVPWHPVPSGFHINHESGGHTLVVWIGGRDLFLWNEVLIPGRLGMGKKESNCIYLDYFGMKGRTTVVGCRSWEMGGEGRGGEGSNRVQWNILVRADLME